MSKAEEKATEKYPPRSILIVPARGGGYYADKHLRDGYVEGYHQAEKDIELTWEDIRTILNIENDILRECNSHKELVIETYPKGEDYYGEILKRFKEIKL